MLAFAIAAAVLATAFHIGRIYEIGRVEQILGIPGPPSLRAVLRGEPE